MPNVLNPPAQRVGQKEAITVTCSLGGETISSVVWTSLEGDLDITGDTKTDEAFTAFIKGDTPGTAYAKAVVTTSTGRVLPIIIKLQILAPTAE